jgi:carbamate kinase
VRIVLALGGNALLRRSEPMTAEVQRRNARIAAEAIAPLAKDHELVVAHGNGPQVGLLALQADAYREVEPYPLDVLGAETEGMIGYLLEQELSNALPADTLLATLLTQVEVDATDPAFGDATKFVGPIYEEAQAKQLAVDKGWVFKRDGARWRRVVPSPRPQRIVEIEPIRYLLDRHVLVICAGGGGIPTIWEPHDGHRMVGVEAVIDKDLASELLAEDLEADLLVMATDVEGIFADWGTPRQRPLTAVTPDELSRYDFAKGSMGPKADAAIRFAQITGKRAAIGALGDIGDIVAGEKGTQVTRAPVHQPQPAAAGDIKQEAQEK